MTDNELREKCREIRYSILDMLGHLGVGHVGGSLSIVEALVTVYYKHMRVDPSDPKKEGRDRFVLSKGHVGPALYAVLADMGFFPKDMLYTLNQPGTLLPSHANMLRTPGVDMTTGSLGQGLSCALGIAMGARLKRDDALVYAILGDGESQEGQVWEAALCASQMKLDNVIAFTDCNGLQIDGTIAQINDLEPLDKKWEAFGWNTFVVDGHCVSEIDAALENAKKSSGKPSMIILRTVKGKGVSFIEQEGASNHNMTLSDDQLRAAFAELRGGSA